MDGPFVKASTLTKGVSFIFYGTSCTSIHIALFALGYHPKDHNTCFKGGVR